MSWNSFNIKAVYDDDGFTPIENAYVHVRFKDNNNAFLQSAYFSGYTNQNGILTVTSTQETSNCPTAVYRVVDENKFLQEGDITSTIVNNTQFMVYVDIESPGIIFIYNYSLLDSLYAGITDGLDRLVMSKQMKVYTKNRGGTYDLYGTYTTNQISFNSYYETTEIKVESYRQNGDLLHTQYISYKNAMFGAGTGIFVCDDYYNLKIPNVHDTINWNDNLTLLNTNFEISLTYNSAQSLTHTITGTSSDVYIQASNLKDYFTGGYFRFKNLTNPSLNTIKVTKNHYLDFEEGVVVSANTNGDYYFLVDGYEENEPIILERELNVCMTNQDLLDYVISLTGIRPYMPNFSGYETDSDLMEKIGVSKLSYYNDWISAITQYLPQQYQGVTASTLNDFKNIFVSGLSTDYVQTIYASTLAVESLYGAYSNHGYVWDRCFIPVSADTFDNSLTFIPYLTKSPNSFPRVSLNKVGTPNDVQIEYRIGENGSWNSYTFDTDIEFNDQISFRRNPSNTGTTFSTYNGYYNFQIENNGYNIVLSGCVNSLLDGKGKSDTELSQYCFQYLFSGCNISQALYLELPTNNLEDYCYSSMFYNCELLTSAPDLPATSLSPNCYFNMFYGCISLMHVPQSLPALETCNSCYSQMFFNCTSLTSAPNLPATSLTPNCYFSMFCQCSSLTNVQQTLPSLTLAQSCYLQMFSGCKSLTTPISLPSTTLANNCYQSMFRDCGLTAVPNLPATSLTPYCYSQMFTGCDDITTMPSLAATSLTEGCYQRMFLGCSSLTGVTNLQASVLGVKCYEEMFEDCTSLQTPPQLNSTAGMRDECCKQMFKGCTSLETIPTNSVQSWQSLAVSCFEEMFKGCTSLSLLPPILPAQTAKDYCYKGMFANCTSLNVRNTGFSILAGNLHTVSGVCESMFEQCYSLTSGITTNSVKIGPDCYKRMFYGCYNLKFIKANFSATTAGVFNANNASGFTKDWVYGAPTTGGTFYRKNGTPSEQTYSGPNWIPSSSWTVNLLA